MTRTLALFLLCGSTLALAACNQTGGAAMGAHNMPGVPAAIADAERTRLANQASITGLRMAADFDPTGFAHMAVDRVEDAQNLIQEEKDRLADEETDRRIAEGEELLRMADEMEANKKKNRRRSSAAPTP